MRVIWNYILGHPQDLLVAVLFAVICAVIVDLLRISSRIHGAVRHIRNKLAEQSAGRIRKRIKSLEQYRENVAMYRSSDKAHYLTTLRYILVVLLFMGIGASVLIFGRLEPIARLAGNFDFLALGCFILGISLAAYALRIASLDTQSKLSEMIQSIDSDIEKLRTKLPKELGNGRGD